MSVLYKALQKAEKENELRQSATSGPSFDTQRLTSSGALKFAGSRGQVMNRVAMAAIAVVAIGGGVAFIVLNDTMVAPAPPAQVAVQTNPPPAPVVTVPPETAPAAPAATPPAETPETASASASAPAPETASAIPEAPAQPPAEPAETQVAAAAPPVSAPAPARPAASPPPARPAAQRAEAMPELSPDSPARMLNPPISVNRTEFALAGVGNQVQVREVAQSARNNASAGYDALLRGSYDTALGFYDAALKEEANSVLALLGRGAALQKLGRAADAQRAYEQVLKLDPANREALTNLTTIVAEQSPQDAINRLIELEREYQNFSPIKAQIGLLYAKMGSMTQAFNYLRGALALSPETVMYHYNLALVLDHLGRKEQAVASYEHVLGSLSGGRGPAELSATEIERRVRFLMAR